MLHTVHAYSCDPELLYMLNPVTLKSYKCVLLTTMYIQITVGILHFTLEVLHNLVPNVSIQNQICYSALM